MPPPLSRFSSAGAGGLPPYHPQFHPPQGNNANHGQPLSANPSYLGSNNQMSPFSSNGNMFGLPGGLAGGANFGAGGDGHGIRTPFAHGNLQHHQQHGQQPNVGMPPDYPTKGHK